MGRSVVTGMRVPVWAGGERQRWPTPEEKAKAKSLRGEGLSYEAIAEILGRGASTIRYWLSDSRREQALEYARLYSAQNPDLRSIADRLWRQHQKKLGLCNSCLNEVAVGKTKCRPCLDKHRESERRYQERKKNGSS